MRVLCLQPRASASPSRSQQEGGEVFQGADKHLTRSAALCNVSLDIISTGEPMGLDSEEKRQSITRRDLLANDPHLRPIVFKLVSTIQADHVVVCRGSGSVPI